jgi:cell wall-associated NlpC family hydrolase
MSSRPLRAAPQTTADALPAEARSGIVRAAIAPLYTEPNVVSAQSSQLLMGSCVDVLARIDGWLHVRGDDEYSGWVHAGYIRFDADPRETDPAGVSLGAELRTPTGGLLARLPWGARVRRVGDSYLLPDGRHGTLQSGEIVDIEDLPALFPRDAAAVTRTAFRWLAAPYLWGGVTPMGVDCSGFVQALFRMHGVILPRDSRLQLLAGAPVDIDDANLAALRAGDLVFFAETGGAVTHVAISLGGGAIIHSAIGNGGVDVNELEGDSEFERWLRGSLVAARRVLD